MYLIINDGAEAYHGVIPEDCWHVPYKAWGQTLIIDYQPSLYASDFALRASTGQGGLTRKTYKNR